MKDEMKMILHDNRKISVSFYRKSIPDGRWRADVREMERSEGNSKKGMGHWKPYIGDMQVRDGDQLKWNTQAAAQVAAEVLVMEG